MKDLLQELRWWYDSNPDPRIKKAADEIERLQELLALPEPPNDGKTHWENCWKDRGHHNCAVAEIERLNFLYKTDMERSRDEVEYLHKELKHYSETYDKQKAANEGLLKRIEQLEAALQWEAAVAGDECAYPTGEFCFDDKPESPDLWCTYCRIIWVLGEKE